MKKSDEEISVIIKGREVAFVTHGSGERIACPPTYVLVHDRVGKYFRPCDFYVVRQSRLPKGAHKVADAAMRAARSYYGSSLSLAAWAVDIPDGGWSRVAKIDAIDYTREGNLSGLYTHTYDPPAELFVHENPRAWRVRLPDRCVVDERGFVWP